MLQRYNSVYYATCTQMYSASKVHTSTTCALYAHAMLMLYFTIHLGPVTLATTPALAKAQCCASPARLATTAVEAAQHQCHAQQERLVALWQLLIQQTV
jgi:hypothetical protein